MTNRLVVWLTVGEAEEEEFNCWYEDEYIPKVLTQIPGIEHVSRWRMPDAPTYLTIYDFEDGARIEDAVEAVRAPTRAAEREAWHEWEDRALSDFRDGFFAQTFALTPEVKEAAARA